MPLIMEGTRPLRGQPYPTLNHTGLEGTRPLTGPALPNLINAVSMLKSKSRSKQRGFDFDFNILTAFIRLGRARPAGAGCPPYLQALCPPYYYYL